MIDSSAVKVLYPARWRRRIDRPARRGMKPATLNHNESDGHFSLAVRTTWPTSDSAQSPKAGSERICPRRSLPLLPCSACEVRVMPPEPFHHVLAFALCLLVAVLPVHGTTAASFVPPTRSRSQVRMRWSKRDALRRLWFCSTAPLRPSSGRVRAARQPHRGGARHAAGCGDHQLSRHAGPRSNPGAGAWSWPAPSSSNTRTAWFDGISRRSWPATCPRQSRRTWTSSSPSARPLELQRGRRVAPDTNIGSTSDERSITIYGLPFERDAQELIK